MLSKTTRITRSIKAAASRSAGTAPDASPMPRVRHLRQHERRIADPREIDKGQPLSKLHCSRGCDLERQTSLAHWRTSQGHSRLSRSRWRTEVTSASRPISRFIGVGKRSPGDSSAPSHPPPDATSRDHLIIVCAGNLTPCPATWRELTQQSHQQRPLQKRCRSVVALALQPGVGPLGSCVPEGSMAG